MAAGVFLRGMERGDDHSLLEGAVFVSSELAMWRGGLQYSGKGGRRCEGSRVRFVFYPPFTA